jgi:ectoine hydroxylase-related dioxygenase (phytanoyl-CoA dioxygenase family)
MISADHDVFARLGHALDKDGFAVASGALDDAEVARLRRAFDVTPKQSSGTQHVAITDATPDVEAWRELEHHPAIVAACESVIGRPYHLGGIHGRNPLPGFGRQGLHSDWTRAGGTSIALVTALWMLDDFTEENGATRVVPGSHRLLRPIPKDLAQPLARHAQERVITGIAGSVLIFNGYLWHSGRCNNSSGPRRAVQMSLYRGVPGSLLIPAMPQP